MISLAVKSESIQVNQIKTTETDLTLEFVDGRTLSVPLTWYPRLLHGTAVERQTFELLDESVFEKLSEAFKEDVNHAHIEKSLRRFR
jgi:hypothetical protein